MRSDVVRLDGKTEVNRGYVRMVAGPRNHPLGFDPLENIELTAFCCPMTTPAWARVLQQLATNSRKPPGGTGRFPGFACRPAWHRAGCGRNCRPWGCRGMASERTGVFWGARGLFSISRTIQHSWLESPVKLDIKAFWLPSLGYGSSRGGRVSEKQVHAQAECIDLAIGG